MGQRHILTRYTVLLAAAGLAVNLALSQLAIYMGWTLYLDSVGTILAAILGGYLPGIIVGFFSNMINGAADPITLYYSFISILLACAAAYLTKKGWFIGVLSTLLSVLIFAFIGGVLGSGLTWLLYGFNFGSGISSPFAIALHNIAGLPEFAAQLVTDTVIDLADKLITMVICFATLKLLPASVKGLFANGHLLNGDPEDCMERKHLAVIRRSLRSKVVILISMSTAVLGAAAIWIGFSLYKQTMTEHFIGIANSVASTAEGALDGDMIEEYLESLQESEQYLEDEMQLQNLRDSVPNVQYVYVYQIREDGCHVVFDVDTPELEGGKLGDVLPMEEAFLPYRTALLAGEDIPPMISNGAYGWLLTAYVPVKNSGGETVAYAAADIPMQQVMTDRTMFVIKMVSLLFGVAIVIVAFALWFAERRLVDPINAMAEAADDFAYDSETQRKETTAHLQALDIHTGDEIENLFDALKKTVTDVSDYITDISKKSQIIASMQHNIIMSFANLVENRDMNTGQHIKHTAAYVDIIAREMLREGKYKETVTPAYIDSIVRSAPLHDLGKIKVSDAVLNKPGRLTAEEFEQMKTHTSAGREILEGVIRNGSDTDYLSEAVSMAFCHHERWDGGGYPQGLKGESIPISARIMAVADVYDALVSKRSYKEAMSSAEAYGIICGDSGSHFDPEVVEAFVTARAEIEAVATGG